MPKTDPDKRAKELHDLIKDERKKRHTTTAVANTQEDQTIVGTSDSYMRKEIKEALLEHETPADLIDGNHAEENVIDMAEKLKLNITEIGASRPICADCEELLKEKNIEAKTEFSGKKSKKRKS